MKQKLLPIFLILSIIINIFLLKEIFSSKYEIKTLKNQITNLSPKDTITQTEIKDCKTTVNTYNITWVSMQPLILDNSQVQVEDKYYECQKNIKRWDIVEVYFWYWDKMIKILKWLPNDLISFDKSWKMLVNWEILKNSKWEEYIFSTEEINNINSFVINWKLRSDAFLIFWDNTKNSIDSRNFWPIAKDALKGKIIKY